MKLGLITLAVVLTGVAGAAATAQMPPSPAPEQQPEATSNAEYASKAIEAYKKAYALDPKSQVIGERLAEMYWKAQRIHDAVAEAQGILKRDPDNVQSRRLLGRIYLRSLGDVSSSNGQPETV